MSGAGIIPFDYSLWQTAFPELSSVSQMAAGLYWDMACIFLNNTYSSVVTDSSRAGQRNNLLNFLTAHIAKLLLPQNGETPPVGRISNASEGSVSVAFDMPSNPNAAWFNQTAYGALFWAATAQYRTMRYIPAPTRYLSVSRAGFGGRGF